MQMAADEYERLVTELDEIAARVREITATIANDVTPATAGTRVVQTWVRQVSHRGEQVAVAVTRLRDVLKPDVATLTRRTR